MATNIYCHPVSVDVDQSVLAVWSAELGPLLAVVLLALRLLPVQLGRHVDAPLAGYAVHHLQHHLIVRRLLESLQSVDILDQEQIARGYLPPPREAEHLLRQLLHRPPHEFHLTPVDSPDPVGSFELLPGEAVLLVVAVEYQVEPRLQVIFPVLFLVLVAPPRRVPQRADESHLLPWLFRQAGGPVQVPTTDPKIQQIDRPLHLIDPNGKVLWLK